MKRVKQVAVGILASLTLGLGALSAQAQPDVTGATNTGMMGPAGHGQPGQMAAGQHGRMSQAQQGAQDHGQHGAASAGPAVGGCPMAAQHMSQNKHSH